MKLINSKLTIEQDGSDYFYGLTEFANSYHSLTFRRSDNSQETLAEVIQKAVQKGYLVTEVEEVKLTLVRVLAGCFGSFGYKDHSFDTTKEKALEYIKANRKSSEGLGYTVVDYDCGGFCASDSSGYVFTARIKKD